MPVCCSLTSLPVTLDTAILDLLFFPLCSVRKLFNNLGLVLLENQISTHDCAHLTSLRIPPIVDIFPSRSASLYVRLCAVAFSQNLPM